MEGGAEPVIAKIIGEEIRNLNPDERTTGALFRHSLIRGSGTEWTNTGPGIYIKKGNFDDLLEELKEKTWYLLSMDGDKELDIDDDPVFFLGDNRGFPEDIESKLQELTQPIKIGELEYHTDQCIVHLNILLDSTIG